MKDIMEEIKLTNKTLSELGREELYSRLSSFKGGKWIHSPEYAELNRRLDTFSIKRLEEEGYDIPNGMRTDSDVRLKKLKKDKE